MKVPDKDTNCELSFKKVNAIYCNVTQYTIMKRELQIDLLKSFSLKCFFELY